MAPDLLPNRSNLLNQRNTDVVRLILQSLNDLGYSDVAKKLEIESGLVLESKQMISFRNYLINGDWDALDAIVDQLDLFKGSEKVNGFDN
ncbi:hypothetical protein BC833DRAFT_591741 [Globomyces pollinis-pini]|nr:hypothetical protein BC833DRAFT_591741 [Globomyces pollinis-pini]